MAVHVEVFFKGIDYCQTTELILSRAFLYHAVSLEMMINPRPMTPVISTNSSNDKRVVLAAIGGSNGEWVY